MWGGGKKIGENNKKAAPQNHCAAPRGPIALPLVLGVRRPLRSLRRNIETKVSVFTIQNKTK